MTVRLANGPVSWGVDFSDAPSNPPWPSVLDGIALAGYSWLELGPVGYLPEDPGQLRDELARRALGVTATFVFEPLHDGRQHARILETAHRACRLLAAVGGRYLVIIDLLSAERMRTAGRSEDARRLEPDAFDVLVEGVEAVATVAMHEYGLVPVLHPHVGTYVEFEDEIDALLAAVDPALLELCIDTGHSAYAGIDPIALYDRNAERVSYLHLKDVSPAVHGRARRDRLDFDSAVLAGVFCRLGAGVVDFRGLLDRLELMGFDGFATVEQDRDPRSCGDPGEDARRSLSFLREAGLGSELDRKRSDD